MRLDDRFYTSLVTSSSSTNTLGAFPIPLRILETSEYYPVSSVLEYIKVTAKGVKSVDIIRDNMNQIDVLFDISKYPMRIHANHHDYIDNGLSRMLSYHNRRRGGMNSFSKKNTNYADYSKDCNLLLVVKKKNIEYLVSNILLKQDISSSIFELWLSTPNQAEGHFSSLENQILRYARSQNIKIVPKENFDEIFKFYKIPKFKGFKDMQEYLENVVDKFVQTL